MNISPLKGFRGKLSEFSNFLAWPAILDNYSHGLLSSSKVNRMVPNNLLCYMTEFSLKNGAWTDSRLLLSYQGEKQFTLDLELRGCQSAKEKHCTQKPSVINYFQYVSTLRLRININLFHACLHLSFYKFSYLMLLGQYPD